MRSRWAGTIREIIYKVEFRDDSSGQSEWMWVRIERSDEAERIVFGRLDNEPVVNNNLRRKLLRSLRHLRFTSRPQQRKQRLKLFRLMMAPQK
jgi:hypothetical protein